MEAVMFFVNGFIKKNNNKSINQSLILFKILNSLYTPLLVDIHFLSGFDKEMYPAMPMERRYYLKIQFKSTKKKTTVTNKINCTFLSFLLSI